MVDTNALKTLPCYLKLCLWEQVTHCEIPALDLSSEVDTRACREINFAFYQQMEISRC